MAQRRKSQFGMGQNFEIRHRQMGKQNYKSRKWLSLAMAVFGLVRTVVCDGVVTGNGCQRLKVGTRNLVSRPTGCILLRTRAGVFGLSIMEREFFTYSSPPGQTELFNHCGTSEPGETIPGSLILEGENWVHINTQSLSTAYSTPVSS